MLAAPRALAQHPLAHQQQHDQAGRHRRLHHDQRRQRERQ